MPSIEAFLREMIERGASDLHITTGTHPQIRLHGKLTPLSQFEVQSPQDTQRLAYSVLNEGQKQKFEEENELDLSFGIQGLARFRCNVYRQRGAVAAAIRVIPVKIRGFDELGLPAIVEQMAERPKGLILVTGPTGSGKSTTLAAMVSRSRISPTRTTSGSWRRMDFSAFLNDCVSENTSRWFTRQRLC